MRNRDVIAILIVVLFFVAGAVFLTESNHKKHTDPAFPDNSLEFIQMDVETGRKNAPKTRNTRVTVKNGSFIKE